MIAPPLPPNEESRLHSLRRLGLLNTAAEERFDRLVRVTARLFGVPIATVTLVDEDRQFFKAKVGVDGCESSRDTSFCAYTILDHLPFIVPDASKDARFYDNPLVVGAPHIRFYAGIPLAAEDGMLVGTLCIIDREPHDMTQDEVRLLEDMAALVQVEMNALSHQHLLYTVHEKEKEFAGIFTHAATAMALVSMESRWLKVNKSLCRMVGYTEAELVGKPFRELTHPEDREKHVPLRDQLLSGDRGTYQMEKRYVHKDGHVVWVNVSVSLFRDEKTGDPRCYIAQMEDITERKRMLEELNWKTAFFEANVNSSPDGIVVVDRNDRKILQNERMVELWKIPREIADDPNHQRQLEWAVTTTKKRTPVAEINRIISSTEVHQDEVELKDGTILDIFSTPVVGAGGANYGRIFQFRDVTESKRAAEELARLQEEYERILYAVEDGVHWIGADGRVKFENPAAAQMLGYRPGELVGKRVHETIHHTRADGTPYPEGECFVQKSLRDGEVRRVYDEVFWRKDGTFFDVEYTCTPVIHRGQPNGLVVTFTDVTRRKKVELETKNARLAAELANQAKTDFLANMSHEIRTPLNGIIGMTDLIRGTQLTAEQKDYLETIHASSENLLTIVNDVLDFSKIEFGKLELDFHAFSLLDLLDDVVGLLNFRVAQKKLEFVSSIEDGLPVDYVGDATRIRQVLINLVTNAIKFTEKGVISIEVGAHPEHPGTGRKERWLQFRVCDTGIGIPMDRLDRLFKVFSQVDASTTRRYGGSGLGLAICKRLVEAMGGRITVDSEPGAGSTFTFDLPLELARPVAAQDESVLAGQRVLIVDDNRTNRRMLALQVSRWKMTWRDCSSPHEALEILQSREHFDVALLDFQMPDTDGLGLARQIRQLPGRDGLPMILVSSQAADVSAAEIKETGFAAVIAKPVRQNLLRSTLQEVLKPVGKSSFISDKLPGIKGRLPIRILVVEDNLTNQKVAQQILKKLGYPSDLAANGAEAVKAVKARFYDLIFMDVHMPEMDGLEATKVIREMPGTKRPMIVALTADVLKGERETCLNAGMDEYITKPLRMDALKPIFERLEEMLAQPALSE